MTEMNALTVKKTVLLASAFAALSLCGCVAFEPAADPASPLAPRVQQLVDENRRYPRWEDFPAAPTALPRADEIASHVNTLKVAGVALSGEVSRIDWTLTDDPEAFVASVNRRIDSSLMSPATIATAAEIEAFAESLRQRAKAPPPVDRPLPLPQ